ncbi:MAG: hypothetical protein J3K34DRAFT_459022 [Monoraphidium minutum]|nr:MAG: hypothetical protein J3K34DRAFT_459022 [Monoraphidium minutum]
MAPQPPALQRESLLGHALLALLLAAAAAPAPAAAKGVQLSSSVMVFENSQFWSKCDTLLAAAATHGSRSVNIVPTFYWIDSRFRGLPRTCNPDGWAVGSRVDSYCYQHAGQEGCQPWNRKELSEVTRGLTSCLTKAFDLFDEVLVSPHLDDGTRTGHWRNLLIFDPLEKDAYGFSYDDIMIRPITRAARAALSKARPGAAPKTLWFGMQGEMGGTVFHHPEGYSAISRRIRADLSNLGPSNKVLIGALLNHALLPGVLNRGPDPGPSPQPPSAMAAYSGGWGPLLPLAEWPGAARIRAALPAARTLFERDVDFLGISNYNRAPVDVGPSDMENAVAKYEAELAAMGIDLQALIRAGKRFIYNEVALGGGVSECGNVPATTAEEAARFPWMGIYTRYTRETDPFKTYDPRAQGVAPRKYMHRWYDALLEVLARGGLKYKVEGAYIWSCCGSWDIQGVYSSTYADAAVTERIRQHNKDMER